MVFQMALHSSIDISCFVRSEMPIRFPTKVYLRMMLPASPHMDSTSLLSRYFGFGTYTTSSLCSSAREFGHGRNKSM